MQGKTAFFWTRAAFSPISTNPAPWAAGHPCCFFKNTDTIWKELLILYHIQSTESTIFCNFCTQNCEVVLFYNPIQDHSMSFVQVAQFDISRRISLGHFLEKYPFFLSFHDRPLRTNIRGFRPRASSAPAERVLRPLHLQPSARFPAFCRLASGNFRPPQESRRPNGNILRQHLQRHRKFAIISSMLLHYIVSSELYAA